MQDRDWPVAMIRRLPESVTMKLRKVSGDCEEDFCPSVYVSDRGTAVMQGDPVADAEGLELGEGEMVVELPVDIVLGAVFALAQSGSAEAVQRLREALKCF